MKIILLKKQKIRKAKAKNYYQANNEKLQKDGKRKLKKKNFKKLKLNDTNIRNEIIADADKEEKKNN